MVGQIWQENVVFWKLHLNITAFHISMMKTAHQFWNTSGNLSAKVQTVKSKDSCLWIGPWILKVWSTLTSSLLGATGATKEAWITKQKIFNADFVPNQCRVYQWKKYMKELIQEWNHFHVNSVKVHSLAKVRKTDMRESTLKKNHTHAESVWRHFHKSAVLFPM